jgi:hypothetical protein
MPLVKIPILDMEYRFRKLTYREEFALIFPHDIDPCRVVLTAALVEVFREGYTLFPVSDSATAGELLRPIPQPGLARNPYALQLRHSSLIFELKLSQ